MQYLNLVFIDYCSMYSYLHVMVYFVLCMSYLNLFGLCFISDVEPSFNLFASFINIQKNVYSILYI